MNDLFDIFLIIIFWLIGFAGGYYFAVSGFQKRFRRMQKQLDAERDEGWKLFTAWLEKEYERKNEK